MRSAVADLLEDAARAFEAVGVRWYLFGAQAAILHGAARLSADVDITVDLGERATTELAAALSAAGFELLVTDSAFVDRTRVLPFVHRRSRMPLDVVLAGPGIEEEFFRRSALFDVDGVRVPVASAEDIVSMKILAGRSKDVEDAISVIGAQGVALDLDRIRATLRLLEAALDMSDLLPRLDEAIRAARRIR
jgi:hypothetical protein